MSLRAGSIAVACLTLACGSSGGSAGGTDGGAGSGGVGGSGGSGGSAGAPAGCVVQPAEHSDVSFGQSVSIDGNVLAVGADTPGASLTPGAVHVFRRSGAAWQHEARLDEERDSFGSSVSVSADSLLVGSHLHEEGSYEGKAYVYRYTGAAWALEATLEDPEQTSPDYNYFGADVALDGDTAVIGAPQTPGGAAYAFRRSGATWALESALTPPDASVSLSLGSSVDLAGDLAIVGAPGGTGVYTGTAHVFRRQGSLWAHEAELSRWGAGQVDHDSFGNAVAIAGDVAAVAARQNEEHGTQAGAVYVYRWSGSSWAEEAKLWADGAPSNAFFGSSLALSGNRLLVTTNVERAYVFEHDGASWVRTHVLESSLETFGWGEERAGLSGAVAAVGAYGNYGSEHPGGVCVFDL